MRLTLCLRFIGWLHLRRRDRRVYRRLDSAVSGMKVTRNRYSAAALDLEAELEQPTMNARGPPQQVRMAHLANTQAWLLWHPPARHIDLLPERRETGWGAWIRTRGWRNQNPLPYHLATPHQGVV